jgi:hypothetical protein
MISWKGVRSACAGVLVAAALVAGASPANAANILTPMLLTFNDLPGFWAQESPHDCQTSQMESLFDAAGARPSVAGCLQDRNFNMVDETLGLWPTHSEAEAAMHDWIVQDEQIINDLYPVNPHHGFPVPVIMLESLAAGPANAFWEVAAVKGRIFVDFGYQTTLRVNLVITYFERALNKIGPT